MYSFRQIKERDTISIALSKLSDLGGARKLNADQLTDPDFRVKVAISIRDFINHRFLNDFVLKIVADNIIHYFGFKFFDDTVFEVSYSYFDKETENFDSPLVVKCDINVLTCFESDLILFNADIKGILKVGESPEGLHNLLNTFLQYKGKKWETFVKRHLFKRIQSKIKKACNPTPLKKATSTLDMDLRSLIGDDIEAVHYNLMSSSDEFRAFVQICYSQDIISILHTGYLVNNYIINRSIEYRQLHKDITTKPRKGKDTSTNAKPVKTRDILLDSIRVVYKKTNINHPIQRRPIARKTDHWEVVGHPRHLKNGKTVFIKPYSKGVKREDNTTSKNYILK